MEYTDIELKNEQWKDIDGYDGMYQVSDLGRVRSKKYGDWRLLKPHKLKIGYLSVNLSKNGEEKIAYIHRLVAQAFIPNDDETKTIINHRNSIRDCNRVDNLEWCDYQYNNTYNDIHLRRKTSKFNIIKKLYCTDLSVDDNLELFRANGIECCNSVLYKVRKELGLTKKCEPKRDKIKPLYNPDLTIRQNLDIFKANGIECGERTVRRLRKDLGLINPKQRPKDAL